MKFVTALICFSTDQAAYGVLSQVRLTVESVLEQNRYLPMADVDGQVVVLSLDAGAYFDFNRSATKIWGAFTAPRKVNEILTDLAQQHDLSTEAIAQDVLPFLEQLVNEKLLHVIETETENE